MLRTLTLRRTAPAALAAAAVLLVAGCGSSGGGDSKDTSSDSASDSPTSAPTTAQAANGKCHDYKSGAASDAVKVSGAFGKKQDATFTKPLKADDIQRTLVTTGTGAKTAPGQQIETMVTAYVGTDGKSLGSQPLPITVGDSSTIAAFSAGVECVPFGSRVVVAVPAVQMYGASGNPQVGVKADDTIVLVTDVIRVKPELKPAAWTTSVPKVTFKNGKPTLTLSGAQPKDLLLKVLRPGSGTVVKKGDNVTVDYQGTNWRTKKIFDQSYGKQPATFATDQVVEGFGAALVGQKVGTRLVVAIPSKYGYVSGNPQAGIKATDVIVFVVEIKSTKSS
jgi:FKBP-type peptidyl-prolyl cis-trans isomerase